MSREELKSNNAVGTNGPTQTPREFAKPAGLREPPLDLRISTHSADYPLTVREAAKYLGVSPQTVYLWVERKQIPHLRVMGRNIRFLKSDLEPFRASFKQEMRNG
jgi:excisionase family DNA binding protein